MNLELYLVIGLILMAVPFYIGLKIGQSMGVMKVLDPITEFFSDERGDLEILERTIEGREVYLNSQMDFYEYHKASMDEEERSRHVKTINENREEINDLRQKLTREIKEDPDEYEIEKLVTKAKRETVEKFIHTASFANLIKRETENEYLEKIK